MADTDTIIEQPATESIAPASEPVAVEQPAKAMHEMSREERREFLQGTDTKAAKATTSDGKTADSSTAPAEGKKAVETATSKVEPASEPGAPAKDKKARNSEENRVNELLEDRRRERERADRLQRDHDTLTERLKALESGKKPDAKTDSSTAAKPSTSKIDPTRLGADGMPDIDKYAENELSKFFADLVTYGREQANADIETRFGEREQLTAQQSELHREMERVVNVASERLGSDEKAHPDLIEKVNPKLRDLVPMRLLPEGTQPNADHFIKDCMVFDADHPLQLHAFYSTDEGWAEWAAMRNMDRRGIERTIARRDLSFGSSSQSQPAAESKTVAKTRSTAPPPPERGGPKSATTADAADQAVKAGDFNALIAELDEREGTVTRRYGRRR